MDDFKYLDSKERVKVVNALLEKEGMGLKQVAERLQINYSTFTKLMQEDDYTYIKRYNRYCKFVLDEGQLINSSLKSEVEQPEWEFIKSHLNTLKKLVEDKENNYAFHLDKRIYHSSSQQVAKNFRITEDIYKQFADTCYNFYPHLKYQDIISQLLLKFVDEHPQIEV